MPHSGKYGGRATFGEKVGAIKREHGFSDERARKIVGAMVRDEKKPKRKKGKPNRAKEMSRSVKKRGFRAAVASLRAGDDSYD